MIEKIEVDDESMDRLYMDDFDERREKSDQVLIELRSQS
jgi:hypothetical protein